MMIKRNMLNNSIRIAIRKTVKKIVSQKKQIKTIKKIES